MGPTLQPQPLDPSNPRSAAPPSPPPARRRNPRLSNWLASAIVGAHAHLPTPSTNLARCRQRGRRLRMDSLEHVLESGSRRAADATARPGCGRRPGVPGAKPWRQGARHGAQSPRGLLHRRETRVSPRRSGRVGTRAGGIDRLQSRGPVGGALGRGRSPARRRRAHGAPCTAAISTGVSNSSGIAQRRQRASLSPSAGEAVSIAKGIAST